MRTFAPISDEMLVVETIRRLRRHKIIHTGRIAPDGTNFERILPALIGSGLMTEIELMQTLSTMLNSDELLITGYASLHEAGPRTRAKESRSGIISRLHPDAKISTYQFFTPSGTPIVAKFKESRLIYPSDSVTKWRMRFRRIYIVSDGLPASIKTKQKRNPIQPY